MKIKTFQALTMSDAIRAIKEELGPDAVILSSKQVRQAGGMFGLFGRVMVEVAAASDVEPTGALKNPSGGQISAPQGTTQGRKAAQGGKKSDRKPDKKPARFDAALRRQMEQPVSYGPLLAQARLEPRQDPAWQEVKEELLSLRRFMETSVRDITRHDALAGAEQIPAPLAVRYQELLRRGLEPETALRIVRTVQDGAGRVDPESDAAVTQALRRALVREVKVAGPLLGLGEWKKTVIFTGPTGVGKTTTIAKLAAHYKLKEKKNVALITLDTYRLAAVEQLKLYANVIGVSLDVALTKREALDCIKRRHKAELILIDTAGRSPMDEAGLEELRQLIDLDHPLETHLVLSAATRERDLAEGLARYGSMPINRLLFTKLDETSGFGGLFDLMLRSGLPLSYFSTGQNVPEDLEVARPERVADLVLGGPVRAAKPTGAATAPPRPIRTGPSAAREQGQRV